MGKPELRVRKMRLLCGFLQTEIHHSTAKAPELVIGARAPRRGTRLAPAARYCGDHQARDEA